MAKELGEMLSKTTLNKITNCFFITKHAMERLKERTNIVGETLVETINNVHRAVWYCDYAYNGNDGSVYVVLKKDLTIVFQYDDDYKKWQLITIKEPSKNGYTAKEKFFMARTNTIPKATQKKKGMTDYTSEKKGHKKQPYKRDKKWKGEW